MKESQGEAMIVRDPFIFAPFTPCNSSEPSSRGSGNSLLLLQLRTELEGKWRPDKLGILRKWMNVSPKHWFCQKEDVNDYAMRPAMIIRNARKSNAQKQSRKKGRAHELPSPNASHAEHSANTEGEKFVDCSPDSEMQAEKNQRRAQRFELEEEVMDLQKRLQKEIGLHVFLEAVINPVTGGARPRLPQDLPSSTFELLEDIAALEASVLKLEEKSVNLIDQIGKERKECEYLRRKDTHLTCTYQHAPEIRKVFSEPQQSRRTKKPSTLAEQLPKRSPLASPKHLSGDLRPSTCSQCSHCSLGQLDPPRAEENIRTSVFMTPTSKQHASDSSRRMVSPLTWKSRAIDPSSREAQTSGISERSYKHSFLSSFDPHNRVQSTAALLQEPPMPFSFSPARYSASGASNSDLSRSSGSGGCEQDLDFSLPATPEHRARPTSPASSSDLRIHGDSVSDVFSKRLSRFLPSAESSNGWSCQSGEEFFTPKTSSSIADLEHEDSQPSSTEKGSKVRVKLDLQFPEDCSTRSCDTQEKRCNVGEISSRGLLHGLLSPYEFDMLPRSCSDEGPQFGDFSSTPNLLSEEMIKSMISIYCHLADPAVISPNRSCYDNMPSPNSHFGHTTLSSFSSTSESSLLSLVRSPLVDHRSRDDILGYEGSPDPYRVRGKIPWADLGFYSRVLEVPWMTVTKDQLGYAAQALYRFRMLVEQLPFVDLQGLTHSEKLAFWLNLHNALMMHAYLAYGVPRNDLKYFALLQKAAYNVGGHSFSAATIEYSLLRGKTPCYRPQMGLLLGLHRNKFTLTEEQSKFAIEYPEPQIVFALSCGARSSPAVRVYTAEKVHTELKLALRDYARATVGMNSKGKLLVPKLLYSHAHEFVEDYALMDWICQLLPTNQAALILECWQHRQNRLLGSRKFALLPFDFNFRYLFAPLSDISSDLY